MLQSLFALNARVALIGGFVPVFCTEPPAINSPRTSSLTGSVSPLNSSCVNPAVTLPRFFMNSIVGPFELSPPLIMQSPEPNCVAGASTVVATVE